MVASWVGSGIEDVGVITSHVSVEISSLYIVYIYKLDDK